MLIVLLAALVAQAGTPIPADKEQAAALIVAKAARTFYERWGATAADDGALLKEMVSPAFAQQVVNQRVVCARQGGACADLMTCLPERGVVDQVRLRRDSTTTQLLADVTLHGATSGAVVTVLWDVAVARDGVRVKEVRCPSTPAAAAQPTASTPAASRQGRLTSRVKANSRAEQDAVAFLEAAIAAGSDVKKVGAVLRARFSKWGISRFIDDEKACMEYSKDEKELPLNCAGNGLTCIEGDATLTGVAVNDNVAVLDLSLAAGGRRTLSLYLDEGAIDGLSCSDPDHPAPTAATTETTDLFDLNKGQCLGLSTCGPGCSAPGCFKGKHTCLGFPHPCIGRARSACFGDCHWSGRD